MTRLKVVFKNDIWGAGLFCAETGAPVPGVNHVLIEQKPGRLPEIVIRLWAKDVDVEFVSEKAGT